MIKNNDRNKKLEYSNVESVSNKYGFIKQTDQFEERVIASEDLSNYYIIRESYFAYNPSRINVGSIAYKEKDSETSIVSPLYVSFFTDNLLDDNYLWYWFKTPIFESQRRRLSEGGVRDTLSFSQLSEMEIKVPAILEQKHLGFFIKKLDRLITLHQRKQYHTILNSL